MHCIGRYGALAAREGEELPLPYAPPRLHPTRDFFPGQFYRPAVSFDMLSAGVGLQASDCSMHAALLHEHVLHGTCVCRR